MRALPTAIAALAAVLPCQGPAGSGPPTPPVEVDAEALADALQHWSDRFDNHTLQVHDLASQSARNDYRRALPDLAAGLRITEQDALLRLLRAAEHTFDPAVTEAVLQLCAAGYERRLFDSSAIAVRDRAHWTLMQRTDTATWDRVLRAARGDDGAGDSTRVGVQVAALRLLADRDLPVFRPIVERHLAAGDPRLRLAAAEAIGRMRSAHSAAVLGRALATERHPVVAAMLLRGARALLRRPPTELGEDARWQLVRRCLRVLGRAGWRTDLAVVELCEQHPCPEAIDALIGLLRQEHSDTLVETVNARAQRVRRSRAWHALQRLLGALLPIDAPDAWAEFWQRERDTLELKPVRRRAGGTRASFFGVPITGVEIAFVVDTSGSMRKAVRSTGQGTTATQRQRSRLAAACEQLTTAVNAMDPDTRYHLYTFANDALVWNRKPVPPTDRASRSLTETLARLEPEGGTNVFDALVAVLDGERGPWPGGPQPSIDEVFLLSDGEPSAGAVRNTDAILAVVREINRHRGVRIHTVFTGEGLGADFLRELARQNNGVFVQR